jgi:hypothetical protein
MKLGKYNFQFAGKGTIQFDPCPEHNKFKPYWCIAKVDEEIAHYYRWLLLKHGVETYEPNKLWGFHISAIKGEAPKENKDSWAKLNGSTVNFFYGNYTNYSNGRHSWLDCYSEELCELREFYGLRTEERKLKFHMTLGRLKKPWEPDVKRPGVIYNDNDGIASI